MSAFYIEKVLHIKLNDLSKLECIKLIKFLLVNNIKFSLVGLQKI